MGGCITREISLRKWRNLVIFIENFDVPNRSIKINTNTALGDLCFLIGDFGETRFVYDIYYEIGSTLRMLSDLDGLWFNNEWFVDLGPILTSTVNGERHKEREDSAQQSGQQIGRAHV